MRKIDPACIIKEQQEAPTLSKKQVVQTLIDNLVPVYKSNRTLPRNKYVEMAIDRQFEHWRVCTLSDLRDLRLMKSLTDYQKEFFAKNTVCVAVINQMGKFPISIVFRSLTQKAFLDISLSYWAYGFDFLRPDFKYGDWLVLVEGFYDAESLRPIFNDVAAMYTSNLTINQADVLKTLTNRFILFFDDDSAGGSGIDKAKRRLTNCTIKVGTLYPGDKDVGVMEELKFEGKTLSYKEHQDYYRTEIQDILSTF